MICNSESQIRDKTVYSVQLVDYVWMVGARKEDPSFTFQHFYSENTTQTADPRVLVVFIPHLRTYMG